MDTNTALPDLTDILPLGLTCDRSSLLIGGIPLTELAAAYGTPLYVYDELTLRSAARQALTAFGPLGTRVSYAAKACALGGVLSVFREEGLNLDVVSHGEIEAGLRAGFAPDQLHLHGNCKSDADLLAALRLGIHAIVADSVGELRQIERLADEPVSVWLRLELPLTVQTHPHVQTASGSKFGILPGAELDAAITVVSSSKHLRLEGLHAHLGSQIADAGVIRLAAEQLYAHALALQTYGFDMRSVSVGGGWAVPYLPSDARLTPSDVATALAATAAKHPDVVLAVEPGRALVARGAVALYRVGAIKWRGGRRIIAVDGGMGDNPRPALYGSRYTALPVAGANRGPAGAADVVGRYCESGDVLARDVALPDVGPGDLLCVPVAGAYQLSMASAYNLVPPPAAVMANNNGVRPLLRRAVLEDLFAREHSSDASPDKR
jgi:diaminopimelate decarboxylase